MTTLIGSRWKYRKVWSRGVLICPVSRAELCIAHTCPALTLVLDKFTPQLLFVFYVLNIECSVLVVWREGYTRSHSEHGSQAFLSRWYSFGGRVGCRQLCVQVQKHPPLAGVFAFTLQQDVAYTNAMTWSAQRKLIILAVVGVALLSVAGATWYFFFR